jgi:glucan 1,3-beta-glucosidase
VWLADHDIDGDGSTQVSIFSGRGILSQSAGPTWLIGTGEQLYSENQALLLTLIFLKLVSRM